MEGQAGQLINIKKIVLILSIYGWADGVAMGWQWKGKLIKTQMQPTIILLIIIM